MSNLDRTKQYMVLNYNASQVFVHTRDADYAIPAGSKDAPVEWPMDINEITYINNTTPFFKTGMLLFEEEYEADIYEALRIRDWRDILRIDDIDDIILNPTVEKLERVIRITAPLYFNRIYARYIYLKNLGRPISGKVEQVMKLRYDEFQKNVINSKIQIGAVDNPLLRQAETDSQIKALQEQIAQLTALLTAPQLTAEHPSESVALEDRTIQAAHNPVINVDDAPEPEAKSAARKPKTNTKKGTPKQGA